ncbi:MAG TPA: hypothetical protein PLE99_08180 [Candidatus Thiothrix moscowensis]|uniref:hypothetical protein n=1 Tax=unclassified Thiothrix TaxID=2636184 RepID=UPI001A2B728E|nr:MULTISPECIES: hypothetical protein [unclassified Thiothrix]MBJ6610510.1 hypothetical protein [Candidatus Thiothrix moscowensis]HRJ52731.1 hypothetical protein [Candidatus Thiothrix moscowensis]HRJ92785.1 hypothetical protein [Candidatus Thiothrix moscowensis]
MLKHTKTGPLKVALLSISPHNRAILEFFFAGAGRNLFKVVTESEADVLIVDYDHPGARDEWEKRAHSGKPGIVLSVHSVDIPNGIWIPKPLTSKALTEAANQASNMLVAQPSVSRQVDALASTKETEPLPSAQSLFGSLSPQPFGVSSTPSKKLRSLVLNLTEDEEEDTTPATPSVPVVETVFDPAENDISMEEIARPVEPSIPPEVAERRWRELCGEHEDVHNPSAWHLEVMLFTPENYLLTNILDALRLTRQADEAVQINLPNGHFALLMPSRCQAYCTLDTRSDEFSMLCNNPVQTGQVTLHIPSSAELNQLQTQAEENQSGLQDMEAFVWVISLLTSRGRMSRSIDINQQVSLKHWPNMTRLEQFPHIMRIAALWNQRPGNAFEIAQALDIPQRYVFAFYTAASTLNLFEMDQTKLKSREKEKPKEESRGLFSRLLKRLLGGGRK